MKSILETSVHLIIFALICYVSIDFIQMNMCVAKVNEVERLVEDYVEIYGESDRTTNNVTQATKDKVASILSPFGMTCTFKDCKATTRSNKYYEIEIAYSLNSRMFHLQQGAKYTAIVRIPEPVESRTGS